MLRVIIILLLKCGPTGNLKTPKLNSHIGYRRKMMSNSFLPVYHQDLILESMLFRVSLPLRSSRHSPLKSGDHSKLQNSPMSNFCHSRSTISLLHMDATKPIRKESLELMAALISTPRIRNSVHMDVNSNGKLKKVQ